MADLTCPSIDTNFLNPNGFFLQIERMPLVSFFCQDITLPDLSLPPVEQPTPLVNIQVPTDKLQFSPLTIEFAVDAKMRNWQECFKWMQGLGFPENYEQYTRENQSRGFQDSADLPKNYSDATLFILGKNNEVTKKFKFVDCYPSSLGGIRFSTQNQDVLYAKSSITLHYSYFFVDE